jgi:GAF domain-containing protein
MFASLLLTFANWLATFNQILTAAIVITAGSLLLYTFTFNLHNRVARSYAGTLAAVSAVFLGDVLGSLTTTTASAGMWLRFQWLGIAFLPPAYIHISDALLETTGLPSRGRRRMTIRVGYILALVWFAIAVFTDDLVGDPKIGGGAEALQPGWLFPFFTAAFVIGSAFAWFNIYRSYERCLTSDTRRRMSYFLIASITLPFSVFPYLLIVGGQSVGLHPFIFWFTSVTGNIVVAVMLVVMAYVVAFFGQAQPDRVIKGRLFQWLLRGPIVASVVLMMMVLAGRLTRSLSLESSQAVQLAAIVTLLVLQFVITLVRVPLERLLFYGGNTDRLDVQRLQLLEERLLTSGDTEQYLESVVAAVCDLLRVSSAFVASVDADGARIEARVGPDAAPAEAANLSQVIVQNGNGAAANELFVWDRYWVLPLHARVEPDGLARPNEVLGLLALSARAARPNLTADELQTLDTLAERATVALEDRRLQRKVFATLDSLLTEVDKLQRIRAAARYSSADVLKPDVEVDVDLVQSVREALNQYWGGPKLTNSPLLRMRVVEQALADHDGNPANALRAVLHLAIERLKPEGQRKFTAEWILYNILELKFMQGQTVRQVATRLAVSESDLYRKQKVAIQQVARMIAQMEQEMSEDGAEADYSVAG